MLATNAPGGQIGMNHRHRLTVQINPPCPPFFKGGKRHG